MYNIEAKDNLPEEEIKKIEADVDGYNWWWLAADWILPEWFIEKFADKNLNWALISRESILSENFITKYADKVDWEYVSWFQKLSPEFIARFADKINFAFLAQNKNIDRKIFHNDNMIERLLDSLQNTVYEY